MKNLILITIASLILFSCNSSAKVFDSEIGAIRDQTEVLKELVKEHKRTNDILEKQLK